MTRTKQERCRTRQNTLRSFTPDKTHHAPEFPAKSPVGQLQCPKYARVKSRHEPHHVQTKDRLDCVSTDPISSTSTILSPLPATNPSVATQESTQRDEDETQPHQNHRYTFSPESTWPKAPASPRRVDRCHPIPSRGGRTLISEILQ